MKVFLRPLLSTSYQMNYKKGKLNNSNSWMYEYLKYKR